MFIEIVEIDLFMYVWIYFIFIFEFVLCWGLVGFWEFGEEVVVLIFIRF